MQQLLFGSCCETVQNQLSVLQGGGLKYLIPLPIAVCMGRMGSYSVSMGRLSRNFVFCSLDVVDKTDCMSCISV